MIGRRFTAEDVPRAREHLELHTPGPGEIADQQVCCSATHLILAPEWPCAPVLWARAVLKAEERGELESGPSTADEVKTDDVAP